MKKILILALVSLVGCGGGKQNYKPTEPEIETTVVETYKVAETNLDRVTILNIRGCEYLQSRTFVSSNWFFVYTHLGDCQNPIHRKGTLK